MKVIKKKISKLSLATNSSQPTGLQNLYLEVVPEMFYLLSPNTPALRHARRQTRLQCLLFVSTLLSREFLGK